MISPLENKPRILERIGLFAVLFGSIESRLGIEFYFVINQQDAQKAPILDFLSSQDFSKKLEILKLILGDKLYEKLKELNTFRNYIAHGMFGMNSLEEVSVIKQKRYTRKYGSIKLDESTLDKYISEEREVLNLLHELNLKRINSKLKKSVK